MAKHSKPKRKHGELPAAEPSSAPKTEEWVRPSQTMSAADKVLLLTEKRRPLSPLTDKPAEPVAAAEPKAVTEPPKPEEKPTPPADEPSEVSPTPKPISPPPAPLKPLADAGRDAAAFPEPTADFTPRKRRWPWVVGAVVLALLVGVTFLWTSGALSSLWKTAPANGNPSAVSDASEVSAEVSEEAAAQPATDKLPGQMRGAFLQAGVDFATDETPTADTVKAELTEAFEALDQWDFNTIFLPMTGDNAVLYPSATLTASPYAVDGFDVVRYILDEAAKRNLTVWAVIDCGVSDGSQNPATPNTDETVLAVAKEVTAYGFTGYLLDGYAYTEDDGTLTAAFETQQVVKSVDKFAENAVNRRVNTTVAALRKAQNTAVVGLLCDAVWANAKQNENGSETAADYTAYTDGHADTRAFVKNGVVDAVVVKAYTRLDDTAVPFETVMNWWNDAVADTNVLLYSAFAADRMGTGKWTSPDELALQWSACAGQEAWHGGVFHTLAALQQNRDNCATVLKETLEGEIDLSDLAQKLTFTSPESDHTTTDESSFTFQGTSDPNFPLLMNGKEVERSEHGLFAVDVDLKVGDNPFTFKHKGKTVTFTVTHSVDILKSVSPTKDLSLSGGTEISVSAIAHKNATVVANIGGKRVPMSLAPIKSDTDDENTDSDYVNFSGAYTLPEGIAGKAQSLGAISVTVSYNGLTKTLKGGSITVEAEEIPEEEETETTVKTTAKTTKKTNKTTTAKKTTVTEKTEASSDSSAESKTTKSTTKSTTKATTKATTKSTTKTTAKPTNPDSGKVLASGKIMKITEDYAETFNNAVEDYSRPTNAYLPAGTLDVLTKEVYDSASGNSYYLLGCGKRVYKSAAKVSQSSGKLTANAMTATDTSVTSDATTLTLSSNWKVPFGLQLLPQNYPYIGTMGTFGPEYDITSFTANRVDITFHYTTAVSGAFSLSGSPLFSKAEWIKNSNNTCTLRLTLKKAGQFFGYSVVWDDGGHLVFRFRHTKVANGSDKPLAGMTIVVDAGHGGEWSGTYGAIDGLYEKTLTLSYALELQKQLKALGATVVMSRTTDVKVEMHDVTALTRASQADLFISIHMDGVSSASANGPSVHYFTEYSYAFAKSVADKMYSAYTAQKTTTNRGARWNPYYVTRISDCPAILLECGFMTNIDDLELLINDSFKKKLCTAIAEGTIAYTKSTG